MNTFLACQNQKCRSKIEEADQECSRCKTALVEKKTSFRFVLDITEAETGESKTMTGFSSSLLHYGIDAAESESEDELEMLLNEKFEGKTVRLQVRLDERITKEGGDDHENEEYVINSFEIDP